MAEVDWEKDLVLEQDPQAILDYECPFERFLNGETLASVELIAENCTATQRAITASSIVVRVREVRHNASVTLRVVTGSGQQDDFTLHFTPIEK